MGKNWLYFTCLLTAALFASDAFAQRAKDLSAPEFSMSIGYGNISLGSNSGFEDQSGLHLQPEWSFSPLQKLPQLRLGADIGSTIVFDNSSRTVIINNGGTVIAGSSSIPLWTLEPELTLSWRQAFGANQRFFIEPGIAGGGMFGFLSIHSDVYPYNSYSKSAETGYGKAFLRSGFVIPGGIVGVEGSYLSGGDLDFGGSSTFGKVTEYYVGIFGTIQF
jgi:hypothetical protein